MLGVRDDELMARWVQYGVFSPINRLHSTDNPFNGKEPWKFDKITRSVMEEYLRLRHGLIPYLYTMNKRAHEEDLPLIQPLYYKEPEREEAYHVPNEYYFGSELLVSPITDPQDQRARAAKAKTWLPEGLWADFFDGMVYRGGRMMDLWRGVENIPVLMKAGAIVPMADMREISNCIENPAKMEARIFPAADGQFTLWEDAGDTAVDRAENWAATKLSWNQKGRQFVIEKAKGNLDVIPKERSWKIVFTGVNNIDKADVEVTADGVKVQADIDIIYDAAKAMLTVEIPFTSIEKEICVAFMDSRGLAISENDLEGRCYGLLEKAQIEYNTKSEIMDVIKSQGRDALATLLSMELDAAVFGMVCEVLAAR